MRRKLLTVNSTELMTWDRDADMIIFESVASSKEIVFTECVQRWTRHDIELFLSQLYHQKDCICRAIDFQIRSRCAICSWLDHFFVIISCQCRCLINWYVNSISETFFLLLAWIVSESETTYEYNFAMNSFLEYLNWNEFSFEFYMSRLHTFDCFES